MISKILDYYKNANYDFRKFAFEADPLKNRFNEWVDYYRMKWAISKAIEAKTILEIGVRYGYSAHAFLSGSPQARYIGVDADEPSFGGDKGAVDWAREALRQEGFSVEIIKTNTQKWSRFPDGCYDLVHVDGQQDGDGTYHDLDMAIMQSKYILVDGYHWTRQNFLAVNEWLWNNRAAVEFSINIPGYAGDLLIRSKFQSEAATGRKPDSAELVDAYTSDYYLRDCGGYEHWHDSRGAQLDARLQAVADAAMAIGVPRKVVDLGAGRGELSAYFAKNGADVTAIDYSSDAEKLIAETVGQHEDARRRVVVVRGSVTDATAYSDEYDLAVAADIVEHLAPHELDKMYEIVSEKLKISLGSLVIHTAPNKWNYQYQHPREQESAISAGFWLPRIRRTWYERLMHINEQSPRVLKKQLSRFFPYVQVWLSDDQGMGGSLVRPYTIQDCRKARSIFAIASHRPLDIEALASNFCTNPFSDDESKAISFAFVNSPRAVRVSDFFEVEIRVANQSGRRIASLPPHPYHLSYHWRDMHEGVVQWEGHRTLFAPALLPGVEGLYKVKVQAPAQAGIYRLEVAAVQEAVRWREPIKLIGEDLMIHVTDGE